MSITAVDEALARADDFARIICKIGPVGDEFLRCTQAEKDRHTLALEVRKLRDQETS